MMTWFGRVEHLHTNMPALRIALAAWIIVAWVCGTTIAYTEDGGVASGEELVPKPKSVQTQRIIVPGSGPFAEGWAAESRGDYVEAEKWYRKAAEQGNAAAQSHLGFMYDYGLGVPQNPAEAMKWYRKAAAQGERSAQNNIGSMYVNARGVPRDDVEAAKWYRKAADRGDAAAQFNLVASLRLCAVSYREAAGLYHMCAWI
jgi:hypothetical protein